MDIEQAYQKAEELLDCKPEARVQCMDRVAGSIRETYLEITRLRATVARFNALIHERDSLAEQVAELGWQPIETAPNDSTRVWVWGPWGTPVTGRLYREGWHYDWWVNTGGQVPTHWRRILLNPPEATPAQPGKEE